MSRAVRLAAALGAVAMFASPSAASADTASRGPTIALDRAALKPGEKLIVSFNDWQASAATLSVCGNLARRGSSDCDMVDSLGVGLQLNTPRMLAEFEVSLPPAPCPCVIKASSVSQNEVAFAPVDLIGAPVAPVTGPGLQSPLLAAVQPHRAPKGVFGVLRSLLGGRTSYRVTVSVRNRSAETVPDLQLTGTAGRSVKDIATSFDIPRPGPLFPGQTWTYESGATLPAPSVGRYVWQVTASGAGPAAHAESDTHETPTGLILLVVVFVADLIVVAWRRLRRHGQLRREATAGKRGPGA